MMDSNAAVKSAVVEPTATPNSNLRQRVQSLRLPDDQEMQGSRLRWLVWLALVAVIGVGGYYGYRALNPPESSSTPLTATNAGGTATVAPLSTSVCGAFVK